MFYEVIPTKIFRQDSGVLTYSSEVELLPGQIVVVPLGKNEIVGIVVKKTQKPAFKTKPIPKILYETPLPNHLLKAALWLSKYYLIPLPVVVSLLIPKGILKSRRKKLAEKPKLTQKLPIVPLNPAQKQALEALESVQEATKLLHGVTGSGKTNIYLQMALKCLKKGKSTILLVPEIALTSQLVQVFEEAFGTNVTLIHSKKTESERHQIWDEILNSNEPRIVVGPRSALFAPLKNLGLIIIDEAHESTFYQENTPKYSALRLASFIAKSEKISCVLGTATPLVQDYYLAKSKNSLVTLTEKAKKTTPPKVDIIDFKNRDNFTKNRYFSNSLIHSIEENLVNHKQTLIFHNRRGSAPLTICAKCGWQALCPNCYLPLTLHADKYLLFCHTCGYQSPVPTSCPECHHPDIIHKGFGTKLLESELKKLFKTAKIARFDGDNNKTDSLDFLYTEVKSGKIDIIIGTQTLAKGLDLPNLATVGVIQADAGLSLPDYSAEERTFELLTQVIGRIGRGHTDKAHAIVQTYQPDHPAISTAIKNDYLGFYNYQILKLRKQHFPPFVYLAKITSTAKTETTAVKHIKSIRNKLSKTPGVFVSLPAPAFHERTNSGYIWQLIVKSTSRKTLLSALEKIDKNLVSISLDPVSIL